MKRETARPILILILLLAVLTACVNPRPATPTAPIPPTAAAVATTPAPPTPTVPAAGSTPPAATTAADPTGPATATATSEPATPAPTDPPEPTTTTLPITPPPTPTATPSPAEVVLNEPVLVDGERGRLYAAGQVNAQPRTAVLATGDGRLLAAYEPAGELALDRGADRLIIDDGQSGLTILAAGTGERLATVPLPAQDRYARPQFDPATGLVYAFRDHRALQIDPDAGEVVGTIELDLDVLVCGDPGGPADIVESDFDLLSGRLFLTLVTYVCTPWAGVTLVAYDLPEFVEVGRFETGPYYQAVPFGGSLYGTTVPRLGTSQTWAWGEGEPWYTASGEPGVLLGGIVADWGRGLIYEVVGGTLSVVDPATREAVAQVPLGSLADGQLVAHDPITDQLYFLTGTGRLSLLPAATLFAEGTTPEPEPAPATLPARPVLRLRVSPGWPADPSLVGLWDNGACPVNGGLLYVQRDPESGWQRAPVGDPGECEALADVVLSPAFATDRTMLVAANDGETVLRSADGGESWRAAETAFPAGTRFQALFISSGYPSDGVAFVHAADRALWRTDDGGRTWRRLDILLDRVALSPEFGQDRTLMGADGATLLLSQDGGASWVTAGGTPNDEPLVMLSLAPLFARWQVAFAFTTGGGFYRSLDGGASWEERMTVADRDTAQIAYAPGPEEDRPIFLLHGGSLDVSYDGWNSTWGFGPGFRVPAAEFTSLAVSPNYVADGLLFLGTADGRVISADAR